MNKKILIGSILVLTLLLLMPSIPAIQQKTIEASYKPTAFPMSIPSVDDEVDDIIFCFIKGKYTSIESNNDRSKTIYCEVGNMVTWGIRWIPHYYGYYPPSPGIFYSRSFDEIFLPKFRGIVTDDYLIGFGRAKLI